MRYSFLLELALVALVISWLAWLLSRTPEAGPFGLLILALLGPAAITALIRSRFP